MAVVFGTEKQGSMKSRSIDILDIQRNGLLGEGGTGIWTRKWTRNEEVVASISYCLESGGEGPIGVRFMYTISSRNSEAEEGLRLHYPGRIHTL